MAIVADTTPRHLHDPNQTRETPEKVFDDIVDTAQMAVPGLRMITRGENPMGRKYEWLVDYLGSYPSTSTDILRRGEGQDASPSAGDDQCMLINRTGIYGDAWSVTNSKQAAARYGVTDSFDYEANRRSMRLLRMIYWDLLNGTINADAGTVTNLPNALTLTLKRRMGGLVQQITTPASFYAENTLASDAQGTNTSAGGSSFAASDLVGHIQSMWAKGGIPNGVVQCLAGATVKALFSKTFAPHATSTTVYRRRFSDGGERAIDLVVDRVVTEAGAVDVHLDPAVRANEALFFDPEYWHLNMFRDWELIELAQMGHTMKGSLECELTNSLLAPNTAGRLHSIVE